MRICFLGDSIMLHLHRWMKAFVRMGHEVHLITFNQNLEKERPCDGVTFHRLNDRPAWRGIPGTRKFMRLLLEKRLMKELSELVSSIKPDILHAHVIYPYGYIGTKIGFHPYIVTCWGPDIYVDPWIHEENLRMARESLQVADVLTGDSQDILVKMVEMGAQEEKCHLILWGVDTSEFRPAENGENKEFVSQFGWDGNPIILSNRRLKARYNIDILIDSVPIVREKVPDARFLIVSDDEMRPSLEEQVRSLGLTPYVKFTGVVDYGTLKQCYREASVYITIPSTDATSVSLHEAMASGLPVIASDLPSNREWVADRENGCIVPVRDVKAVAEKIIWLLKNQDMAREFGVKNRESILKKAEHMSEMKKMEDVYKDYAKRS